MNKRVIKFRAWNTETQKMVDLAAMTPLALDAAMNTQLALRGESGLFIPFMEGIDIMQFTGLTDSDGKEIYEGDFVEFTYWWFDGAMERDSLLSGVITYEAKHMSFAMRGIKNKAWLEHVGATDSDTAMFAFFNFTEADFHVRGNIYQNPELLNDQQT